MANIVVKDATGKVITKTKLTDARPYWLYDTAKFASGSAPADTYLFQTPEGSNNKNIVDTNLKQFSTLQVGWKFVCNNIRVIIRNLAATAADAVNLIKDANNILTNGVLSFLREGDIEIWRAPLVIFGAGCGISGSLSTADSTTDTELAIVNNGVPAVGAILKLPIPIILVGGRTFVFKMSFKAPMGGSLSNMNADTYVWVVLEGMLSREVVGG